MNKVCKEYISDAKKFFPIIGKDERNYLRGLNAKLEEFCEDNNINSKQELFEQYSQPYDIANDYYECVDTEKIIKKIKISKYVKTLISMIIVVLLILSTIYIINTTILRNTYIKEEIVVSKSITENYKNNTDENLYDRIQSDDFIVEDDEITYEDEIIE